MTDGPLHITFDVDCPPRHAFAVWTSQIGTWWPPDHTVTGGPDDIVLERRAGGRIYETSAGVTHAWGEVTVWEPPRRLSYRWHLGRDRADATDVDIRFVDEGGDRTRIEIEHTGWERLGDTADTWRDRNRVGWDSLLPHFVKAVEKGAT
jgi:uncharacterized protein YndB with AHSA1/START domain